MPNRRRTFRAASPRSSGFEPAQRRLALKPAAAAVAIAMVGFGLSPARTALAGPSGGVVSAGTATIQQSGTSTVINQATNRAALDWQSFSIGRSESVIFNQPSSASVASTYS